MVDGSGLENRRTRKGTGGSNPSLSATQSGLQRILALGSKENREFAHFWRFLLAKSDCRERTCAETTGVHPPFSLELRRPVRLATTSEANSWRSQTESIAKAIFFFNLSDFPSVLPASRLRGRLALRVFIFELPVIFSQSTDGFPEAELLWQPDPQ